MVAVLSVSLEFEVCVVDKDYEIATTFPHQIRKIANKKIIKEGLSSNGYVKCTLNKKLYYKHQIIARQFIPNPNNFKCIDHLKWLHIEWNTISFPQIIFFDLFLFDSRF